MMTKQVLAVFAIAALVLSCEKEEKDIIDKKYQGDWILATKSGDQLIKATCLQSTTFSRLIMAKIEAKKATIEINLFPGNTTCNGTEKIVSASTAEMEDAGSNDDQQVLKMTSSSEKVTVTGASAAKFLNDETACGRSDWKEGTYDQNSAEMKTCNSDNEGYVISTPDTEEVIKVKRFRLKETLGGLAIGSKKESEDDAEFDVDPSYFLKN